MSKWSRSNLRKGIIPPDLFNNGGLPKVTIEGELTLNDIKTATFFFGFPMLFGIGEENHVLCGAEDLDTLLSMISCEKLTELTLQRPASIPKMKPGN